MVHISRLAEELVLWMSPRYGFVRLPDRFTTGSSIMPQKKNPDVPELARGKSGRVVGHLVALLTLMKGQPLAYNKDNQEDKEPLFDTVDTVLDTLRAFVEMVPGIEADPAAMRRAAAEGHSTATDLADYLVRRGVPFREAHEAVARAVKLAATRGVELTELPLRELQTLCRSAATTYGSVLTVEGSVAARDHLGGTAPRQVRQQIEAWNQRLAAPTAPAARRRRCNFVRPFAALSLRQRHRAGLGHAHCRLTDTAGLPAQSNGIVAQPQEGSGIAPHRCHMPAGRDARRRALALI